VSILRVFRGVFAGIDEPQIEVKNLSLVFYGFIPLFTPPKPLFGTSQAPPLKDITVTLGADDFVVRREPDH
jgi:hypothetical protein